MELRLSSAEGVRNDVATVVRKATAWPLKRGVYCDHP